MEERIESTGNTPQHRQFKLTPLPGEATNGAKADGGRRKSSRRLILGGSAAAVPLILTIPGRPAFANKVCTASIAMSARNSTPLGGNGTGQLGPCGDSLSYWRTNYSTIQTRMGQSYKCPAQLTANNYLSNLTTHCSTSGAIFTYPATSNHTSFATYTSNCVLSQALAGTYVLQVAITHPYPGKTFTDTSGFLAQLAAAILNAAMFGSSAFGYDDAELIPQINNFFASLQTKAGSMQSQGSTAQQIATQLQTMITNETASLSTLNSQSGI